MSVVSARDATRSAADMLSSGAADDPLARDRGRVLDAIEIRAPGGDVAGWFVPVELEASLLGFVQLAADGVFRRYASFHGRSDTTTGCPAVADWADPKVVTNRARRLAVPGSQLSTPVLSYDKYPDRLAWMIQELSPYGGSSTIFVAGTEAWRG